MRLARAPVYPAPKLLWINVDNMVPNLVQIVVVYEKFVPLVGIDPAAANAGMPASLILLSNGPLHRHCLIAGRRITQSPHRTPPPLSRLPPAGAFSEGVQHPFRKTEAPHISPQTSRARIAPPRRVIIPPASPPTQSLANRSHTKTDDLQAFTTQAICLRDDPLQIPRIDVQPERIATDAEVFVERLRRISFPNRAARDSPRLAASAAYRKEDTSCHAMSQRIWPNKGPTSNDRHRADQASVYETSRQPLEPPRIFYRDTGPSTATGAYATTCSPSLF
jgi:hypothetical protein